ncbi:Vacuolar Protein [Desmophyllum pertusum]|uniref:Vacuolar Protein n=1 Tax=Desmophyllum pertusum TaxID=174260 RepID=A0A9W9YUI4_9CNID|nr:Vacuolar Protein [Desmophyllum pertusum]
MPPKRTEVPSSHSRDQIPEEEGIVKKESNETLSAHPPPEEHEQRGLAGTQVGHTIANIGSLFGGIFAPHQDTESNDKSSENIAPDVAVDDDNIISLTVDGFYNVSCISIARSGLYLQKLSPKDAVLREANHKWYLVVQVEIKNGRKTVTIRSPLQVQNHLQVPVDIFVKRKESSESKEDPFVKLFTVEPSGTMYVPLYTAYNEELFVKPSGTK